MSRALFRLLASLLLLLPCPALAAVTVTFWSQELGENFPHAFITLNGTPRNSARLRAAFSKS